MLHRHGARLKKKLQKKFAWTEETFKKIDWPLHGEAVRKIDKIKYVNILKSIFEWQAVNKTHYPWY